MELSVQQVVGNAAIVHAADVTKLPEATLAQEGEDGGQAGALEHVSVRDSVLPSYSEDASQAPEVEAIQFRFLSSICRPCLVRVQQSAQDAGSMHFHLCVLCEVVVGPHFLMELRHHSCGLCDPAVDLRLQGDVGADDIPPVLEPIDHVEFLTP